MKRTLILLMVLVASALIIGACTSGNTGYSTYGNNPNQQQQKQYVGGGCGVVAPADGQAHVTTGLTENEGL